MRKKLLLIGCLILLFDFSTAQNPLVKQWDYRYGGDTAEYLNSLQQTLDGGYILGGTSYSGISGDKTQSSWGSDDYWIVKINSVGSKQWDKRFGGAKDDYLNSVQQTTDGGYILGGYSESEIGGDKTQPNWDTTCNPWCTVDYWVVKIDSLGNKQWDKRFGGTSNDNLYSLQQTIDGGYILGGFSTSGVSGDKTQPSWGDNDYWIIKIDSLGNKLWDKRFGGTDYEYLSSLRQTSDEGYILGGWSWSGISGDKTQPSWGAFDYWIVKTDSLGIKQWDKRFGGTAIDVNKSLQQSSDGGYILGGLSYSTIGGDKTQPLWGFQDYWIIKTDSLGNKQWDKDLGGTFLENEFGNITQTYDGGYLMAGSSESPMGGDKTENNLGVGQAWIVTTNSLGIKQWDKTVFTTGADYYSYTIQTNDGCYVIVVTTNGDTGGYKTQPNWDTTHATSDFWIVKFCDTTITGTPNLQSSIFNLQLNPNPFTTTLTLKGTTQKGELTIFDITGKEILHQETFEAETKINTAHLTPGFYFINYREGERSANKKVVKL